MINQNIELLKTIAKEYNPQQIEAVLGLIEDGNTVPFIARYRKEMTGSLDEVQIRDIVDRYEYLTNLEKRKEEITRLIDEQGKLTPDLQLAIQAAQKLQTLEDLYRPYKQKRRTKAMIAKEKGLEPLALRILEVPRNFSLSECDAYINPEFELNTREEVIAGVHEILAESFGDVPEFRTWIRDFALKTSTLEASLKKAENDERKVYEMYYEFAQSVRKLASHRILAINRAEKENVLKVSVLVDDARILNYLDRMILRGRKEGEAIALIQNAYDDAYKRFIWPSIEREVRNALTESAEKQAIKIFGENLRNLLLQSPLKGHVVMGFDPAYRSGCKLAIVDDTGKVLAIDVIYPHTSNDAKIQQDTQRFINLIKKYNVDTIAIGNGTASRESELYVAQAIKEYKLDTRYVIVNEAGASVYSASDVAREEFPDLEVEKRSAVSIARRIQDPLAELVKIDPKSVGVGQYQHDVSQKELSQALDFVVETAVNQVGVDVNTASTQLLMHISGLSKTIANNIVKYREENGAFESRSKIKSVPRLGPKSFEQAIGFLRIPKAKNILDATGIHPESYDVVKQLIKDLGIDLKDIGSTEAREIISKIPLSEADKYGVGQATFKDILDSLAQPGRDMRDSMTQPLLRGDVVSIEDMVPGMKLQGTVRNVVDFGAFVDIGVKQDGLVHISKLSKQFVKHPTDVVSVGDIVTVWVIEADINKQRVQLSMIEE